MTTRDHVLTKIRDALSMKLPLSDAMGMGLAEAKRLGESDEDAARMVEVLAAYALGGDRLFLYCDGCRAIRGGIAPGDPCDGCGGVLRLAGEDHPAFCRCEPCSARRVEACTPSVEDVRARMRDIAEVAEGAVEDVARLLTPTTGEGA